MGIALLDRLPRVLHDTEPWPSETNIAVDDRYVLSSQGRIGVFIDP